MDTGYVVVLYWDRIFQEDVVESEVMYDLAEIGEFPNAFIGCVYFCLC